MKLSEVVKLLSSFIKRHGDVEMFQHYYYSGFSKPVEMQDFEFIDEPDLHDNPVVWINPWGSGT